MKIKIYFVKRPQYVNAKNYFSLKILFPFLSLGFLKKTLVGRIITITAIYICAKKSTVMPMLFL